MLIYKQRYKPRTTREFTKSDLTVYDSAGNTALNALTVYGKSEVVDDAIVSAGEGYAVVDLGTLEWSYTQTTDYNIFEATVSNMYVPQTPAERVTGIISAQYPTSTYTGYAQMEDKSMLRRNGKIIIKDSTFTDAVTFKTAMSGVLLCYELSVPSQDSVIAVKTDNGTGIDGTIGVFTTGTPLRATLDGTVKDEMRYNGITGEVITRCEIVNDEVVPLATPIITPLTAQEMTALAELRTSAPQTHAQNNAGATMTVDYTIRVPTI